MMRLTICGSSRSIITRKLLQPRIRLNLNVHVRLQSGSVEEKATEKAIEESIFNNKINGSINLKKVPSMNVGSNAANVKVDTKISGSGNAIIGMPRKALTPSQSTAKARKLRQLTSQAHDSISMQNLSVSKIFSTTSDLFFLVDRYLGYFYKGLWSAVWTSITNPAAAWKWLKGAWDGIVHEAKHYWSGFKLLGEEIRTSTHLFGRRLAGHELTRRERKQLVRTTADIFRVVPLALIIIIPFMEFAAPFIIRVFPNILPSTFQDQFKQEESMKKQLQLRLEIAEFMQDMVIEMGNKKVAASNPNDKDASAAVLTVKDLEGFIEKTRRGERLDKDILYKVTKLFSDDLTIENMNRSELVLLCRYMGLTAFGGDNFLRMQLRQHINDLRNDDRTIFFEGVESLNLSELKQVCQDRGMRATGLTKEQLRKQMTQWLDLSVNKNVPTSLLILSRAFIINEFGDEGSYDTALEGAIGGLDTGVTKIALAENLSSLEGVKADAALLAEKKLEAVRYQNKLIELEGAVRTARAARDKGDLTDKEVKLREQELEKAIEQIKILSSDSAIESEKEMLKNVISKREEFLAQSALSEGRIKPETHAEAPLAAEGGKTTSKETKSAPAATDAALKGTQKRFEDRLQQMIKTIEKDLGKAGESIGSKLKMFDLDGDGRISNYELRQTLKTSFAGKYSEAEIQKILETLDLDEDGSVTMEDIDKVIQVFADKEKMAK